MTLRFSTLPPSTNHLYGRTGRGVYMKPDVKEAKDAIGWEARNQYRGEPLTGALKLSIAIYWPDKRRRDIDNGLKLIMDALTGILWNDDAQVYDLEVKKRLSNQDPRVELEVGPGLN